MILRALKKEDRNNIADSLMSISKHSRLTVSLDFTEVLLSPALVLLSTEVFTSESMTQSSPCYLLTLETISSSVS